MKAAAIYHESQDVAPRLSQLGLTEHLLREAVLAGIAARNSCTPNDPPSLPGLLAWGRTIRALGELLAPSWKRCDDDNFSTVVDAHKNIAIAVATGDIGTGNPKVTPRTKYPKGPATVAAVAANNQLGWDWAPKKLRGQDGQAPALTWLLLIAPAATQVRYELSLPAEIGDDERVADWRERIILEPINLDAEVMVEAVEESPDVVVDVRRRMQ